MEGFIGGVEKFWKDFTGLFVKFLSMDFISGPGFITGWITDFIGDYIAKFLGKIFGGGGYIDVQRVGIEFGNMNIAELIAGADAIAKMFADIHKHTEGGWFGSDEDKFWTEYEDLDVDTIRLLTKIFKNIADSFVLLAEGLGVDAQKALDYIIQGGKLDLRDMNAEQINDAVQAYFNSLMDKMAEDLFGDIIKKYQKIDEGLYETAVRLVMEKEILLMVLKMTGHAFEGTATAAVHFSQALLDISGDLEKLTEDASTYFQAFFSEAEQFGFLEDQLSGAFKDLDVGFPETRADFRSLIESIDLTTESGMRLYVSLLGLAGAADAYYDQVEEAISTILSSQRKLMGYSDEDIAMMDIAQRYDLIFDEITKTWAQDIVDSFLSMSPEEIIEWAEELGVSATQLVKDIMALANATGALGDAAVLLNTDFEALRRSLESTMANFGAGYSNDPMKLSSLSRLFPSEMINAPKAPTAPPEDGVKAPKYMPPITKKKRTPIPHIDHRLLNFSFHVKPPCG